MNVDEYLDALASAAPTPGGGSAAALVAANGAALIAMVARITLRSERYAEVHAQATIYSEQADRLRQELRTAGTIDEEAYTSVRKALALPKTTDEERDVRDAARTTALLQAAEAALGIAEGAASVATLAQASLGLAHSVLESDLLCAVEFALAAANGAAANVLINHQALKDEQPIAIQRERLWKACKAADAACAAVRSSFIKIAAM